MFGAMRDKKVGRHSKRPGRDLWARRVSQMGNKAPGDQDSPETGPMRPLLASTILSSAAMGFGRTWLSKYRMKWCVVAVSLVVSIRAASCAPDWFNAGPLYDEFRLTLEPGQRTEMAGPLFYSQDTENGSTWGFPPLTSRHIDPGTESEEYDVLYPVLTYDRYGPEHRWQFFQLFSIAGGSDQQDQRTRRFTLFPIYFQQRSEDPDRNYTALVPFYGHLKNRLMRDEIFFVMYPAYSRTRKKDVVTENYLYPFFHIREGNGLEGWQIWPFYGQEHKEITSATNGFGEVTPVPGHDRSFVLWPIYLRSLDGIGSENPQKQWAVLPLYSSLRSPNRDSSTVLWPFFSHVTDREKQYREWQTPWPLIVFARGEGKITSRVWPFFSHAQSTNLESGFFAWPIYKYNRLHLETLERERKRVLFFLYSDTIQKNLETGRDERRVDFWPLFTHKRDFSGRTRLQVLSVLEPLIPNNKSIERNYSPLWALWRSEENPEAHASSQSLLWNLYRRDVSQDSKKCSLLFGLFQYESGPSGKRMRLFYVPVTKQTQFERKSQ